MRLERARVQNFRSIVDSSEFDVERGVTVIIGKNEQGKTNLLKGLQSFNRLYQYDAPHDLPTHLVPVLADTDHAGIPVVTLWLRLELSDKEELAGVQNIASAELLQVTKYFDGHYAYAVTDESGTTALVEFSPPVVAPILADLQRELTALRQKIIAHAARQAPFAQGGSRAQQLIDDFQNGDFTDRTTLDNLFETFIAALKGLPGQDAAIQSDFDAAQKKLAPLKSLIASLLSSDPEAALTSQLPTFVLHETGADRIPDSVAVAAFVPDPAKHSRGMANLCKAAGLSVQKIQELVASRDPANRSSYEDYFKTKISGAINEFWTQADYALWFSFSEGSLNVFVSDDIYSNRIPPSSRSDGFQWYLSFYSALTADAAAGGNRVLLLDNPALELHADGQRDVKRFLEDRQSQNAQIIYVTHSPAMVDPFRLEQVRKVERFGNNAGTKVSRPRFVGGASADLLEPVRSAIGANIVGSLIANDLNVLVEGAADKPIIEGALALLEGWNGRRILVNGSVAETRAFLPNFYERAKLPYVVYLDHDTGGRELAAALREGGIPDEKIFLLSEVGNSQTDMELEDVLTEDFYRRAVEAAYPGREITTPGNGGRKRTKRYESLFKERFRIGFSKTRVAEKVKDLLQDGKADDETISALKKLAAAIRERLERQTGDTQAVSAGT